MGYNYYADFFYTKTADLLNEIIKDIVRRKPEWIGILLNIQSIAENMLDDYDRGLMTMIVNQQTRVNEMFLLVADILELDENYQAPAFVELRAFLYRTDAIFNKR